MNFSFNASVLNASDFIINEHVVEQVNLRTICESVSFNVMLIGILLFGVNLSYLIYRNFYLSKQPTVNYLKLEELNHMIIIANWGLISLLLVVKIMGW